VIESASVTNRRKKRALTSRPHQSATEKRGKALPLARLLARLLDPVVSGRKEGEARLPRL
jgi:hypothetical protein